MGTVTSVKEEIESDVRAVTRCAAFDGNKEVA